jgi:hypothetical protein
MKYVIIGLALMVAGCVSQERQAQINLGIQMSFAVACAGVEPGWAAWKLYESKHKISKDDSAAVAGAYATAVIACEQPPVNSAELLQVAVGAALTFKQAVEAAKTNG